MNDLRGHRVIVASPLPDSCAHRALALEGVLHDEYLVAGSRYAYGQLLAELWNEGRFVLVEWDIVPAPGNVMELIECDEPWGAFEYLFGKGEAMTGLGFNKVTPVGEAPNDFASTVWERLDGPVLGELRAQYGGPHVHEPPVAHARRS